MAPPVACGRVSLRVMSRDGQGWMGEALGMGTGCVKAAEASGKGFSLFLFCMLITASRTCCSSPISPESKEEMTCSLASVLKSSHRTGKKTETGPNWTDL